MTGMKKFWKRSAAWVIGLKDKPLRSARFKLTALYVLHAFIILAVFVTVMGYVRLHYLESDIAGSVPPGQADDLIRRIWTDLQTSTALLSAYVLVAIGILSYFSVQLTLRPIRLFLEAHRRFIADASHELRTPLTTMRTEIEVALLDPESVTHAETIEILRSNVEEIDRMSKILTNLLNLASFDDATGGPKFKPTNLAELVQHSANRVQKTAAAKRIAVDARADEPLSVEGNSVALEEVVMNLLKNAVNYSPPGGRVEISLSRKGGSAEIVVVDNGIGIAPDELHHVFEPFYRSERSLHMYKSGSGLGLPLVKEIVKRHHGTIHVESTPNKGTSITVQLPLVAGR